MSHEQHDQPGNGVALGVGVGLALGVAFHHAAEGFALGAAVGIASYTVALLLDRGVGRSKTNC